jgi:hypothetical protein
LRPPELAHHHSLEARRLLRHDCEKLAVAIEENGIGHYDIVRDPSIIQK